MNADEMFKELGYTNLNNFRNGILLHYIRSSNLSANESEHIVFYKNKTVGFLYTYSSFKKDIDMQELQAINEKVKELRVAIMTENRWYDERFIKCKNCKKELIVFPALGEKFFRCKYCGTKIKNKEWYIFRRKNE